MFPFDSSTLAPRIVAFLATSPRLTAGQLHLMLSGEFKKCSVQAVYKELRKLLAALVIVKHGNVYSLSLAWLGEMSGWLSSTLENYSTPIALKSMLPAPGGTICGRFHDILALDRFTVQLLLVMSKVTKNCHFYHWTPHAWFALLHYDLGTTYLRSFYRDKLRGFMIIGGRSKIDSDLVRMVSSPTYRWSNARSSFEGRMDTYISVVGPYILYTKYQRHTVEAIDQLFKNSTLGSTLCPTSMRVLFAERHTFKFKLVNNSSKSAILAKKFLEHFGKNRTY